MKSLAEVYAREILRERRMWAAWPPDEKLTLGTFGFVDGSIFTPQGHLDDFGVATRVSGSSANASETFASAGTVAIATGANLTLPVDDLEIVPGARVEVSFGRKHGVFLLLAGCGNSRIDNHLQVVEGISRLHESGDWDQRWRVVTGARTAELSAVAISSEKDASVRIEAHAEIGELGGRVKLELTHGKKLGFQATAEGSLTPLLELRQARLSARVPVMRGEPQRNLTERFTLVLDESADAQDDFG